MSFIETRVNDLIESVSLQTVGGRQFNTTIVSTSAGFERRNINWSQSRGRWEFGERVLLQSELDALVNFFETVAGRAVGFRFKDWSDFKCTHSTGVLQATSDPLVFELFKRYGTRVKRIFKPVSCQVNVNSIPTSVIFNANAGTVQFAVAPEAGATLTWAGEFDLPARFDVDQLQSRFEAFDEDSQETAHYLFSLPVVVLKLA